MDFYCVHFHDNRGQSLDKATALLFLSEKRIAAKSDYNRFQSLPTPRNLLTLTGDEEGGTAAIKYVSIITVIWRSINHTRPHSLRLTWWRNNKYTAPFSGTTNIEARLQCWEKTPVPTYQIMLLQPIRIWD